MKPSRALTGHLHVPKSMPLRDRVMARIVESPSGCWVWTGAKDGNGYGSMGIGGGRVDAVHRVAYREFVGPVPSGLTLDHLCRNRACCNPAHLEPVTHRENILRGETNAAANVRKVACPRGHLYTEANTRVYGRRRFCRQCDRDRRRLVA